MLLDIAIIVFLMVAAILLILAEIFLLPGITLAGIDFILINHCIRSNLRLVIAFPVF